MERASTLQDADGESNASRDQVVRNWILSPAAILTAALVLATAFSAGASSAWIADLAVHFRLQYAAMALIVFVLFALTRRPVWAAIALGIAVTNGLIAAPLVVSRPAASGVTDVSADDGVPVRLAFVNVFYGNDEYRRVLDFVRTEQPDAIVFAEVDADWLRELNALKKDYPNAYGTRGKDGRGLLLLSRLPMEKPAVAAVSNEAEPALGVTLSVQGKPLHLLGVHATWPFDFRSKTSRDEQLAELAAAAQATPRPLVILGDLNVSPFSSHFQTLLRAGNLESAASGFGWQPTWPNFMPPAGIQIDHALVSPGVQVRNFRRGPRVGSDHLPVVVDLAL
jgi:endonuclease/exonuclease/phosphatase (EEP) superfamily protein YafD